MNMTPVYGIKSMSLSDIDGNMPFEVKLDPIRCEATPLIEGSFRIIGSRLDFFKSALAIFGRRALPKLPRKLKKKVLGR